MKKRLQYIISLSLMAPLMVLAPVAIAHGQTSDSSSSTDQQLTDTEKAQLQSRLEKEKTDLKIKLGVAETALIKAKCTPAVSNIKSLSTRFLTNVPQRVKAYDNLSSHLDTLITKLNAKGVDTTELKQELTTLQAKITTFNTDEAAYKQALSDAKNVDCSTDPAAFKAALLTARTARDKVMKDIADIKAYVKDTIKPTLQKIRTQLASQEQSSSQNQGGNQ